MIVVITLLLMPLSYLRDLCGLFCFRGHKAAEDDPSTNPRGFSENIGRVYHDLSLHVTRLSIPRMRNTV